MLLPSALPCEPFLPLSQPTRQILTLQRSIHPQLMTNPLLASCRALQSILGNAPALSCQSIKHSSSPQRKAHSTRNPLQPCAHNAKVRKTSPLKPPAPRGLKKRRRDEFEADSDDEMVTRPSEVGKCQAPFLTPKRPRLAPLAMPLGLSAADFQFLESPNTPPVELDMPSFEINVDADADAPSNSDDWSAADDRALVETVLEKLRLSKREWNDCARILGKDKDSLGKRWKMLVGEGDVGLRRGGKRPGRTELDIRSW